MRTKDNKEIPSRIWYYLLDWNEKDEWQTIRKTFEEDRLRNLTYSQIKELFDIAVKDDKETLNFN